MKYARNVFRCVLASLAMLILKRNLDICAIGHRSRVNLWRLRPYQGGVFRVGSQSMVRADLVYQREKAIIEIGSRSYIDRGLFTIANRLVIGDDVLISWNVTITDHDAHSLKFSERRKDVVLGAFFGIKDWDKINISPVTIENKAWIGFGSCILKGCTIGEGAVVGANSVVTKDVPPWTVVAGNPAKIIREIPESER